MALQHLATILCEDILRDPHGKPSFIGVFQSIHAQSFPATKSVYAAFVFRGEPGDRFSCTYGHPAGTFFSLAGGEVLRDGWQTWVIHTTLYSAEPATHRFILEGTGLKHVFECTVEAAPEGPEYPEPPDD